MTEASTQAQAQSQESNKLSQVLSVHSTYARVSSYEMAGATMDLFGFVYLFEFIRSCTRLW